MQLHYQLSEDAVRSIDSQKYRSGGDFNLLLNEREEVRRTLAVLFEKVCISLSNIQCDYQDDNFDLPTDGLRDTAGLLSEVLDILEDLGVKRPEAEKGDVSREYQWRLNLNRYQRDNLLWLFDAIKSVPPFIYANTGDWAGEIPNQLGKPGVPNSCSLDSTDMPNATIEGLRNSVAFWLEQEKKK